MLVASLLVFPGCGQGSPDASTREAGAASSAQSQQIDEQSQAADPAPQPESVAPRSASTGSEQVAEVESTGESAAAPVEKTASSGAPVRQQPEPSFAAEAIRFLDLRTLPRLESIQTFDEGPTYVWYTVNIRRRGGDVGAGRS
jgi:hypothetical protein